jgi:hypothetical protein
VVDFMTRATEDCGLDFGDTGDVVDESDARHLLRTYPSRVERDQRLDGARGLRGGEQLEP